MEIPHKVNHEGGKCNKIKHTDAPYFYGYTIGVVSIIYPNKTEHKPKQKFLNTTRWKDHIDNGHELYGLN